ncbi:hypothetical protein OIDMADRAFT_18106, partial [Oidiodendron maius Zn]
MTEKFSFHQRFQLVREVLLCSQRYAGLVGLYKCVTLRKRRASHDEISLHSLSCLL